MQDVDFLPERIKARRRRQRRIVKHTYMLTICLVGLGLLGVLRHERVQIVRAELAQLGARDADIKLQLGRRDELEREKAGLFVIRRIEEQLGSRLSSYMLLSELQRLLPASMTLTQLSVETMDVAMAGGAGGRGAGRAAGIRTVAQPTSGQDVTVKRLRLTLTGLARKDVDVAKFIGQMAACPLFEDVNMGYSRDVKINDRTARQFQASCYVVR